jgi:hypothetical protein
VIKAFYFIDKKREVGKPDFHSQAPGADCTGRFVSEKEALRQCKRRNVVFGVAVRPHMA